MDLKKALQQVRDKASTPTAQVAKAPLVEIFDSFQGEGRFVGTRMLFVRTATCPLRCLYCDTPNSYQAAATFPVRFGVRDAQEPNPVGADRVGFLRVAHAKTHRERRRGLVAVRGVAIQAAQRARRRAHEQHAGADEPALALEGVEDLDQWRLGDLGGRSARLVAHLLQCLLQIHGCRFLERARGSGGRSAPLRRSGPPVR